MKRSAHVWSFSGTSKFEVEVPTLNLELLKTSSSCIYGRFRFRLNYVACVCRHLSYAVIHVRCRTSRCDPHGHTLSTCDLHVSRT
eukprot:5526982-Pyramimonas_sp.AAC.2